MINRLWLPKTDKDSKFLEEENHVKFFTLRFDIQKGDKYTVKSKKILNYSKSPKSCVYKKRDNRDIWVYSSPPVAALGAARGFNDVRNGPTNAEAPDCEDLHRCCTCWFIAIYTRGVLCVLKHTLVIMLRILQSQRTK